MLIPNPNMLVFIGMADAYAMATEYLKFPHDALTRERTLRFTNYVRHPRHQEIAGSYTDDTEMSCANARILLAKRPPYTKRDFADAYVAEFLRGGKRKGYSRGFQMLLENVRTGKELLDRIQPDSEKNGACMRAVPFGVLANVPDMLEAATVQATVTHDSSVGRFSARAVALMSHFAMYEHGPFSHLREYCYDHLDMMDYAAYGGIFQKPWSGEVVGKKSIPVGITTVHAAHHILATGTSLMQMLKSVIEFGGDTDSVAAIVWGIASARFQDEKLPNFLERDLETGNPRTGAPYLRDLGEKLMDAYD